MKNNNVEFVGRMDSNGYEFDHEIYGENFYTQKIKIRRTSGIEDELILMVSDRIIMTDIDISNEIVGVSGEIRTHNDNGHLRTYVYVQDMDVLDIDEDIVGTNNVYLEGYICKKSELRVSPKTNRRILDMVVAINHSNNRSSYLPVITWAKIADYSSTLPIGTKVAITGRLQSRIYKEKNIAYELSVQTLELI